MEIKCKEPGCPKVIKYEDEEVFSILTERSCKKEKTVYLTCENNHTHPYVIET